MDSVTQLGLGAAVGQAVLGREAGNRAILWGAVAGTLPDLDVLANPMLTEIQQLSWHRGPSHAFFYLTLAAPVLGWIVSRIHPSLGSWKKWTALFYLGFITHVLLDTFTVYGTQLLRPFSDYPAAFNSISIIDPLYTLPLLAAVIAVLFIRRDSALRQRTIIVGLAVSTTYLLGTVAIKAHVDNVVEASLAEQDISHERYITTPALFNAVLWRATVDADDGLWIGHYSLLDHEETISFAWVPQNSHLLKSYEDTDAIRRLQWFSRGYLIAREVDGMIRLHDIRFGEVDYNNDDDREWIFGWELVSSDNQAGGWSLRRASPNMDNPGEAMRSLWERIKGNEYP